jgi:site-specific DNA recombinase
MSTAQNLLQTLTGPSRREQKKSVRSESKAIAWARVSTDEQERLGLSIPEQFRQIRQYAEANGIEILGEYHEAKSGFRRRENRHEFDRMIERVKGYREIGLVLVHDYSRFGRDSDSARNDLEDLRRSGIRVRSVTEPLVDEDTSAGVYMKAFTFAKNEAYSRDVGFHTHKGSTANVQSRDPETGWCFKNGGQPLFGYRAERLQRGEVKRGRPRVKSIWVPDETGVAGRTMREWARYCLVDLAAKGASLDELCTFCNKAGIPGRRKQYWGTSTWYALLQPSVLMQYCGFGVWNVRDKQGREKPESEWIVVENAHAALITEAEAQQIAETRRANGKKRLEAGNSRARGSAYLLSGGLFRCERCGSNMTGFHTGSGYYYICGSQPYRKGMGCGPGVYVPQKQVEAEVLGGLRSVLDLCVDQGGFTAKVNRELRQLWEASTGIRPDAAARISTIDRKIAHIRQAVEDGLNDAKWANGRLTDLAREREEIGATMAASGAPPRLDVDSVMTYRRETAKVFQQGEPAERKRLLRNWVQEVRLKPESLEVSISYRLPESVMNGVVAGAGFEPATSSVYI